MKTEIKNDEFNIKFEPSDWRYSAAIVGLARYFDYNGIKYSVEKDCIKYNKEDIDEDKYLKFAEHYYGDAFHHVMLENILKSGAELSDEQIKLANEKLSGNTVMKKIFKGYKAENDRDKILELINENRSELIRDTFKSKSDMYANYCNNNQYFNEKGKCSSRLWGYYVDAGKKSKSLGYQFQNDAIDFEDELEFDFIPFAFAGNRTYYFINNNFDVKALIGKNDFFKQYIVNNMTDDKRPNGRQILFKSIIEISEFIDYDVEVISKERDDEFFETVFIRKESINVLKELKDEYNVLCRPCIIKDNYYDVQKSAINHILNNVLCDDIIEKTIREKNHSYVTKILIKINMLLKGVKVMTNSMKAAYGAACDVAKKIPANKLESFRQKLISAVTFKDYDRAMLILLNLSAYSNVRFGFANDLFEDFEGNKEVIYTFINSLTLKEDK